MAQSQTVSRDSLVNKSMSIGKSSKHSKQTPKFVSPHTKMNYQNYTQASPPVHEDINDMHNESFDNENDNQQSLQEMDIAVSITQMDQEQQKHFGQSRTSSMNSKNWGGGAIRKKPGAGSASIDYYQDKFHTDFLKKAQSRVGHQYNDMNWLKRKTDLTHFKGGKVNK